MDYLGHPISSQGVHWDKFKVQAVLNWSIPQNIKQLRGFLGLSSYYICNYTTIAAPFTTLLKKDSFVQNSSIASAFTALKKAVTVAPVLDLSNFSKQFILETDVSRAGICVILSQEKHPITYFSKKLNHSMYHKSAYVRGLLAVTEAMTKFCH